MYREQYVKYPVVAQGGTKRRKERKGETVMPGEEIEGHRTYGERTGNANRFRTADRIIASARRGSIDKWVSAKIT